MKNYTAIQKNYIKLRSDSREKKERIDGRISQREKQIERLKKREVILNMNLGQICL